jgi:RimJ/RimL family protein N-acetyltransferase
MSILFYRRSGAEPVPAAPDLADVTVRWWSPARDGFPHRGGKWAQNAAWLVLTVAGAFSPPGLSELSLWRNGRMVHRLIVTPRWYRFPFMAERELQLGNLWTDPSLRGRGLARLAVAEACRRFAAPQTRIWYLADAANAPSWRLAETCGFQPVGIGRRTRPIGIAPLGRYRLVMPAA